jgi:hypothetical protein
MLYQGFLQELPPLAGWWGLDHLGVYVEWCDLGCNRVGLKSFVVSIDYQDYMGSSSKIWALDACFCTCALIIWTVLLQRRGRRSRRAHRWASERAHWWALGFFVFNSLSMVGICVEPTSVKWLIEVKAMINHDLSSEEVGLPTSVKPFCPPCLIFM